MSTLEMLAAELQSLSAETAEAARARGCQWVSARALRIAQKCARLSAELRACAEAELRVRDTGEGPVQPSELPAVVKLGEELPTILT